MCNRHKQQLNPFLFESWALTVRYYLHCSFFKILCYELWVHLSSVAACMAKSTENKKSKYKKPQVDRHITLWEVKGWELVE